VPHKPLRPCLYSGCTNTVQSGYCQAHSHFYTPPQRAVEAHRPSAALRGYDKDWQSIRTRVLSEYGVPRELWHLYDVHHEPPYNPAIEPDHNKYKLTPMLHANHSRETARSRGRGIKSLGIFSKTVKAYRNIHSTEIQQGGCHGSR